MDRWSGLTADETARRLNARAGYVVKRVRYAPSVKGVVDGRYRSEM